MAGMKTTMTPFSKSPYGFFSVLPTIVMVQGWRRAVLEGLGKAKSLIGEALSRNWMKKRKRAYITNGASGDLVNFQNPAMASNGQKTTYTYNQTHGLIAIKDPSGNTPARNDYSADGRLLDTVDVFGNIIHYAYN